MNCWMFYLKVPRHFLWCMHVSRGIFETSSLLGTLITGKFNIIHAIFLTFQAKKMKKGVDKRCSTSYYSMYGTLEPTGLDMIEPVNSTGAIQREIKWNKMNMRSFHALWSKLNWFYCTRGKGCQFLGPGCRVPVRCCNSFVWWSFFPMASWLQVDILGFSFKLWFLGIAFLK